MCTIVAQPITWPSILAISIEPYRRSNNPSRSWLYLVKALISRPSMAALLGAFK